MDVVVVFGVDMVLFCICLFFFFFKQKTAYEMRISDWSSDVCSSDLERLYRQRASGVPARLHLPRLRRVRADGASRRRFGDRRRAPCRRGGGILARAPRDRGARQVRRLRLGTWN